jgi:hypothetical protein
MVPGQQNTAAVDNDKIHQQDAGGQSNNNSITTYILVSPTKQNNKCRDDQNLVGWVVGTIEQSLCNFR